MYKRNGVRWRENGLEAWDWRRGFESTLRRLELEEIGGQHYKRVRQNAANRTFRNRGRDRLSSIIPASQWPILHFSLWGPHRLRCHLDRPFDIHDEWSGINKGDSCSIFWDVASRCHVWSPRGRTWEESGRLDFFWIYQDQYKTQIYIKIQINTNLQSPSKLVN